MTNNNKTNSSLLVKRYFKDIIDQNLAKIEVSLNINLKNKIVSIKVKHTSDIIDLNKITGSNELIAKYFTMINYINRLS